MGSAVCPRRRSESPAPRAEPGAPPQSCPVLSCPPQLRVPHSDSPLSVQRESLFWRVVASTFLLIREFLFALTLLGFVLFYFALFLKGLKCHQRTPQIFRERFRASHAFHNFGKLLEYEKSSSKYTKCKALSFPHCKTNLNLACLRHKFQYMF